MKKRASPGFTLIELLVATAVTAIIVGLMITMVNNLLTAYNRSSGALAAQNQASLFLDQIATEVESMVVRNSEDIMFQVTQVGELSGSGKDGPTGIDIPPSGDSPDREFPPIEEYRFGQGGLWLKFFTSAPSLTLDQRSGVRAIGYRIDFNPIVPGSTEENFMLYRTQIPPQVTFDWGYNLIDPAYTDTENYSYSYEFIDSEGTLQKVQKDDEPNGLRNDPPLDSLPGQIIADNVVDFGVRLFTNNADRDRVIVFPTSADQEYAASALPETDEYPRAIEVMLRILTPEGERLLSAKRIDEDNVPQDWWEIVDQNSEVFSRVINIPSRPL